MKQARLEKNMVVVLFIAVLVAFSFAEQESKKIQKLYTGAHYKVSSQLEQMATTN
jgi:hypothetical protein